MADGATYRTAAQLHVWPTVDLSVDATQAPTVTFNGDEMDMDGVVNLLEDPKEVRVRLWNIGDAADVRAIFKKNFVIAVDLARITQFEGHAKAPYFRTCLARVRTVREVTNDETSDIGYEIIATPFDVALQEIAIKVGFPVKESPYLLKHVIEELLRKAGLGTVGVLVDESLTLRSFTADGSVWSEIKRAAGKAGVKVAIWLQGPTLIVSDKFVTGTVLPEEFMFDARPLEDDTVQPLLPIATAEPLEGGETMDVSEEYALPEEALQIATDAPAANSGYEMDLPLAPEVFAGTALTVEGERAMRRMGLLNVQTQDFNVLGVMHTFDTSDDGPMDTTKLRTSIRQVA